MKGIIILANTQLDSCLAAGLVIENINYIQGIKYRHPTPEEQENTEDYEDEEFCDDLLNALTSDSLPAGSIISNLNTDLDICFCDENVVITNAWKVTPGYALIVLIGYDDNIFKKILESVLDEDQEIISLGQLYSTLLLSQLIDWGPRQDHWDNLRIATSIIWQEEYLNFKIDFPYPIGKKMRRQAERIIDEYQDAWKIAYNLYGEDPGNLHLFFVEFMNQVANDVDSQFIKELLEMEPDLTKKTLVFSQKIVDQGQGIGLVKIGKNKLFKTDVLAAMQYYCHRVIEYTDEGLNKKTLNSDYHNNIYVVEGPFIKNELIGKN